MLILRSLFLTIVVPGTVTVLVPYLIVSQDDARSGSWGVLQFLAVIPMVVGATILLRCIWDFAAKGHGTLAPIDPPKELVVQGPYRYVRNPMYLGALILLLGEAAFFQSVDLLIYTAIWFTAVHFFVVFYEEPTLQRQFGESYARYRRSVRRWIPAKPMKRAA